MQYKLPKGAYSAYLVLGIALLLTTGYLIAILFFEGSKSFMFCLGWCGPVFVHLYMLLALIAVVMSLRGNRAYFFLGIALLISSGYLIAFGFSLLNFLPLFLLLAFIALVMSLRGNRSYLFFGIALLISTCYLIAIRFYYGAEYFKFDGPEYHKFYLFSFFFFQLFPIVSIIALVMSFWGKGFRNERKAIGESDLLGLGFTTIFYFSGWGFIYSISHLHVGDKPIYILFVLSVPYALMCIFVPVRSYFRRK